MSDHEQLLAQVSREGMTWLAGGKEQFRDLVVFGLAVSQDHRTSRRTGSSVPAQKHGNVGAGTLDCCLLPARGLASEDGVVSWLQRVVLQSGDV
jgi:hypothetical protein